MIFSKLKFFFVFLWFLNFNFFKAEKYFEKNILLLGPIRSGKSCFINNFFQFNWANIGDEDGEQTTLKNVIYQREIEYQDIKINFNILDTIGLENTHKDLKILYDIFQEIVSNKFKLNRKKLDYIFLFFSLTQENDSLLINIDKLKFFIYDLSNLVILPIKSNVIHKGKMNILDKAMKNYNINKYIHIENDCMESLNTKNFLKKLFKFDKDSSSVGISFQDIMSRLKNINEYILENKGELNDENSIMTNLNYLYSDEKIDKNAGLENIPIADYLPKIISIIFVIFSLFIFRKIFNRYKSKNLIDEKLSRNKKEQENSDLNFLHKNEETKIEGNKKEQENCDSNSLYKNKETKIDGNKKEHENSDLDSAYKNGDTKIDGNKKEHENSDSNSIYVHENSDSNSVYEHENSDLNSFNKKLERKK